MAETVADKQELVANLARFWGGSNPADAHHQTFRAMFKRGKNFVSNAGGSQMMPSRFAGYIGNTLAAHRHLDGIDGGVTDAAITRLLGPRLFDNTLEEAYRGMCRAFDIEPSRANRKYWLLPSEPSVDKANVVSALIEGALQRVEVNAFERDPLARRRCLEHYGTDCCVCDMSFGATYGPELAGFIHVHHIRPLADIRVNYSVDPIKDLRPVCPNCHAVLRHQIPPLTIKEARALLRRS